MLLNEILEKLRHKNLVAALEWAQTHREQLMEQNSSLEFKLHRLQFLQLVSEGPEKQAEALGYVRRHFPPFVHQHETGKSPFCFVLFIHAVFIILFYFQIFKT